jgi:hypothetical protein
LCTNLRLSSSPRKEGLVLDRKSFSVAFTISLISLAGCSGPPETPLSPTPAIHMASALIDDFSTLKVGAPTDLGPNGVSVGTMRPTLTFTNPTGAFASFGLAYEIDVQNASGQSVYAQVIGESPESSAHTLGADLASGQTYWWRVRARLGDDIGPWSDFAMFHVGGGGVAAAAPGGPLPFPIPAECGPFGPGDRGACAAAMTGVSPWWPACGGGSGTNCHRFTRSVAAALAASDGNWGLISKNPGEQQCTWDFCSPADGSGYGEDIVAYHTGNGNWEGWDIVAGAGGPGAGVQWNFVSGRRAGNDWRPVPPFP